MNKTNPGNDIDRDINNNKSTKISKLLLSYIDQRYGTVSKATTL